MLLADDNEMLRLLGAAILRQHGYDVLLAEDGQDAVEMFERAGGRIRLVILDMTMPRLSGRGALERLRRIDPGVRVLFASGYSADQLTEGDRVRIQGFLGKPYREHDLIPVGLAEEALNPHPVAFGELGQRHCSRWRTAHAPPRSICHGDVARPDRTGAAWSGRG